MADSQMQIPRFRHRSLAEYLGILIVVALVITSIANTRNNFTSDAIDSVSGINYSKGGRQVTLTLFKLRKTGP